ncbi:PAN domain-containing protein At5g03700 [Linum grandiflorum]
MKPPPVIGLTAATQFLFLLLIFISSSAAAVYAQTELLPGFKAAPDPSISSFQPILKDPSGNFSLGFLPLNSDDHNHFALSVIHVPSLQPIWQPNPSWSDQTHLSFNGTLVISDSRSHILWSTTGSNLPGDRVVLLDTSNLQVLRNGAVVWQSFDFPFNTLVQTQNFTSATSSDGRYALRLGYDFMALYADFAGKGGAVDRIYWKHKALEARADVVPGQGPIHAQVDPDGFIGMYQSANGSVPIDVQAFNSFRRKVNGFHIVRLETDGNLKAYNWDGTSWVLDYQAIPDFCDLPRPCGSYGLCRPGPTCSCLDNSTAFHPGESGQCVPGDESGDLCGQLRPGERGLFRVLRSNKVDLPFKELMSYRIAPSMRECEGFCENNCTCWGAVYNNASGFCYLVDYPIQTVLGVGDEGKLGYFKVKNEAPKARKGVGSGVRIGLACGAVLVLAGAVGVGGYKGWMKYKRRMNRILEENGVSAPGPYKGLGSDSFRSVEMSDRR